MRDFERAGRSTVYGSECMLATPHPIATSAGIEMLNAGGNAIDAAVAAMAVLTVVDPAQVGLGGDCFALVCPKGTAKVIALDGAGVAPAAASRDWYVERGFSAVPTLGAHSVTVPGLVRGLERLAIDHGLLGFGRLLQPAIRLAEDGHPVHERVALDWQAMTEKLSSHEATSSIFLPHGRPPREGERFRNPALASSLREIALRGSRAFYEGWIAEDIVRSLNQSGGLHTLDDFAGYAPKYVAALHARYRGVDVFQCPASGQGVTALAILKMLDELGEIDDPVGADRFHFLAEASKIAYSLRNRYLGDPDFSDISYEHFLSDAEAARRAKAIDPDRALQPGAQSVSSDTVFVAVIDHDRTAVSLIGSLFRDFGSGVSGERSGILLHNRGSGFNLVESHPNCIEPGKRPMHTIMPGMTVKDGKIAHAFGVVGGDYQPVGQATLLSAILACNCKPQLAIDLPRAFAFDGILQVESGIRDAVRRDLTRRGHVVQSSARPLGGAQIVSCDWSTGILSGGSDGRLDGHAAGW